MNLGFFECLRMRAMMLISTWDPRQGNNPRTSAKSSTAFRLDHLVGNLQHLPVDVFSLTELKLGLDVIPFDDGLGVNPANE